MIPIILAGGSGTRFWPLSRQERPKQLLSLFGDHRSMVQITVERLQPLCADDQPVRIVCRPELVRTTEDALPSTAHVSFVQEPAARNTAPAIAYATAHVEAVYGDEPVAFFPADHFVGGEDEFRRCLRFAAQRARTGSIITLGIPPSRPETGYGYIEVTTKMAPAAGKLNSHVVEAFVEKPDHQRAVEYLASKRHLWNSGIFLFRPSTLWKELERQQPRMWAAIETIRDALSQPAPDTELIASTFRTLESISIDYAVMEGASNIEVVPATFRWSDVGHWAALDEIGDADDQGNVVDADTLLQDVKHCVILSEDDSRLVAASGLRNMVIVDTEDALLILPKERAQKVRDLVAELHRRGRDDLL